MPCRFWDGPISKIKTCCSHLGSILSITEAMSIQVPHPLANVLADGWLHYVTDLHLMACRCASSGMKACVHQVLQARLAQLFPHHVIMPCDFIFCRRTIPSGLVRNAHFREETVSGLKTYTGLMRVARRHDERNPGTFHPVLKVPEEPDCWHLDPLSWHMLDDDPVWPSSGNRFEDAPADYCAYFGSRCCPDRCHNDESAQLVACDVCLQRCGVECCIVPESRMCRQCQDFFEYGLRESGRRF